ncbi:MAG: slipin family protein [Acidobacteriota bacterium]|nr:slipin family protein [Acidobacteriota bacterium]
MTTLPFIGFLVVAGLFLLTRWINILAEYERAVVFRLGRILEKPKGPGLVLVLWPIDRMVKVSLRTVVLDVPPQDIITKDNVSVKVNAVVYFRVLEPTQTELDQLLSERETLNDQLQTVIDQQTDPWGIKVSMVEVKHVDLPQEMQRAMAKQAEAEREKRAKVIHASGELQASESLAQAANAISANPVTLQLRYLQTLSDIATERNSTILFPLPLELLRAFGSFLSPPPQEPEE